MAGQIWSLPPHFQTEFADKWLLIQAQQMDHRLAGTYVTKNVAGKDYRADQYGSATSAMRQKTARAQATLPSDIPTAFRWVRPRPYDTTTIYDEFDHIALGKLLDPQGEAITFHGIEANRNKDIVLINGLLGTNYTGPDGTTAETFPAAQQVGVQFGNSSVNCGLTLKKMTQAAYILDANEVMDMGRYFAYSAKELNNLLTNVDQVSNTLYNDVRALRDGAVRDFMGFSFRRTQLLPIASSIRTCIAWQQKYAMVGLGADPKTHADILPQQSHALQIRTCMLLDATRVETAGVVSIACDESV